MGLFIRRVMGALSLDRQTFEDVEADASATQQALLVVVLSSLATGFGLAHGELADLTPFFALTGAALLGWFAWSTLVYLVGVNLLPGADTRSSPGELLRVTGFAAAPGVVHALAPLSVVEGPVLLLGSVWMLAAMVVGVRQALDFASVGRAIAVCLTGWLLSLICVAVIGFMWAKPVW
jgi:hypothetical protein